MRAGRWLGGWLKGVGILVACPHSIPQNPDHPLQLLKIAINHWLSSIFILVEIAAQLENKSSRCCFPKKCILATVLDAVHIILPPEE